MFRALVMTIAIGAAATAGLSLMPLAHADQDTYIHVLDTEGVEYSSPTNAAIMGEAACGALESGASGQTPSSKAASRQGTLARSLPRR